MKKTLNQQNLCTKHQSSWFLFRNSQPNNHQWGSWVCTITIYCDQYSLDSYTHQRISISSDLELYNKQTVHISHTYYIIIYLIPLPSPQEGSRQVIQGHSHQRPTPLFPFLTWFLNVLILSCKVIDAVMTPIVPAILSPAISVLCRGHPVCCSRSPKVEIWHQWHGGTKRLCAASLPSIPSPWSSRCSTLDLRFPFLPCSFRQTVRSLSKHNLSTDNDNDRPRSFEPKYIPGLCCDMAFYCYNYDTLWLESLFALLRTKGRPWLG